MRPFFYRATGIFLIIASAAGLLFTLVAFASLWTLKPALTKNLTGYLDIASTTLETTSSGLLIAASSLSKSLASITQLQYTVEDAAKSLDETTPLVDTLVDLTKNDLPATVTSAQTSLASAQESARIIDSVLTALSSLPFVQYNPPVPLNESLKQVSDSMNTPPGSLHTIETSLSNTGSNLEVIQADVSLMAANISEIQTSLEDSSGVIEQYQVLVGDMQGRVERARARLPRLVSLSTVVAALVLVWAAALQLGMLVQGWDLLHRKILD